MSLIFMSAIVKDIILLFVGGTIGLLSPIISHVIHLKMQDKREVETLMRDHSKRLFKETNQIINQIIDTLDVLKNKMSGPYSESSYQYDSNYVHQIDEELNSLSSHVKDLKNLNIRSEVIKDEESKRLHKELLLTATEISKFMHSCFDNHKSPLRNNKYEVYYQDLLTKHNTIKEYLFTKF